MATFEFRNWDIIVNPASLEHHHEKKGNHKTNRTPF